MADEGTGVDVDGGHRFGLIDDQIATRLQFNLTIQRALNFIFDIKQVKDRLFAIVELQLTRHLRNIFRSKLHQHFTGQTGVDPDAIQGGPGKITQNTLRQRQLTVEQAAGLVTLFTFADFSPETLEKRGVLRQLLFSDPLCGGTDDKAAQVVTVVCHHRFEPLALFFTLNALRDTHMRCPRHKDQITRRQRDVGGQPGPFGTQRIFDHLHHQILPLAHQLGDVANNKIFLFVTRDTLGVRHDV